MLLGFVKKVKSSHVPAGRGEGIGLHSDPPEL